MTRLNHIVAGIYRAYIDMGRNIPYFRAISTLVFLALLHAFQLAIVFQIPLKYILPVDPQNKIFRWIVGITFYSALLGICALIFPKSKLENQEISDASISKIKRYLPWYFAGTILFLMVLLVLHGFRKGTIHF